MDKVRIWARKRGWEGSLAGDVRSVVMEIVVGRERRTASKVGLAGEGADWVPLMPFVTMAAEEEAWRF